MAGRNKKVKLRCAKNYDSSEKRRGRGGWCLNGAKLMPDYGVKTQSISVREYVKRWLLVDLCLGTIKSTKSLVGGYYEDY